MITNSGVHIQKIGQPEQGTPTPTDIAVHAGRICRFGGAVWAPLLAHLVFVGLLAYKRSGSIHNFIWGLLHDAHEIVTSDVPRPFKCDCMRIEQDALDVRLLERYFPYIPLGTYDQGIDFDLIKQCDHDACDIEAVELGLPGFADLQMKHNQDYRNREAVYTDADDVALFHRVRRAYGDFEVVRGTYSNSVIGVINVLTDAEKQDYEAVQYWLATWGPLTEAAI